MTGLNFAQERNQNAMSEYDGVLGYQSQLAYNRQVFLLTYGDMVRVFSHIDENFQVLRQIVGRGRNKDGKTFASMIPWVSLMQRQALLALDALCTYQSYTSWVLLRPCVEAALTMGKWVDDPANSQIWLNRVNDLETFKKTYEGRKFTPKSLPSGEAIRFALKQINDDYMHTNVVFYQRHLSVRDEGTRAKSITVECFDSHEEHLTNLLAMAHLLLTIQDSLQAMFKANLTGIPKVNVMLKEFEDAYRQRATELIGSDDERRVKLKEFGLWAL